MAWQIRVMIDKEAVFLTTEDGDRADAIHTFGHTIPLVDGKARIDAKLDWRTLRQIVSAEQLFLMLGLVEDEIPVVYFPAINQTTLAKLNAAHRQMLAVWASSVHLKAGDNNRVRIPPRPDTIFQMLQDAQNNLAVQNCSDVEVTL